MYQRLTLGPPVVGPTLMDNDIYFLNQKSLNKETNGSGRGKVALADLPGPAFHIPL